jgi:hypothetical protein
MSRFLLNLARRGIGSGLSNTVKPRKMPTLNTLSDSFLNSPWNMKVTLPDTVYHFSEPEVSTVQDNMTEIGQTNLRALTDMAENPQIKILKNVRVDSDSSIEKGALFTISNVQQNKSSGDITDDKIETNFLKNFPQQEMENKKLDSSHSAVSEKIIYAPKLTEPASPFTREIQQTVTKEAGEKEAINKKTEIKHNSMAASTHRAVEVSRTTSTKGAGEKEVINKKTEIKHNPMAASTHRAVEVSRTVSASGKVEQKNKKWKTPDTSRAPGLPLFHNLYGNNNKMQKETESKSQAEEFLTDAHNLKPILSSYSKEKIKKDVMASPSPSKEEKIVIKPAKPSSFQEARTSVKSSRQSESAPTVHVRIGKVEVRAVQSSQQPLPSPPHAPAKGGFDDYFDIRNYGYPER